MRRLCLDTGCLCRSRPTARQSPGGVCESSDDIRAPPGVHYGPVSEALEGLKNCDYSLSTVSGTGRPGDGCTPVAPPTRAGQPVSSLVPETGVRHWGLCAPQSGLGSFIPDSYSKIYYSS